MPTAWTSRDSRVQGSYPCTRVGDGIHVPQPKESMAHVRIICQLVGIPAVGTEMALAPICEAGARLLNIVWRLHCFRLLSRRLWSFAFELRIGLEVSHVSLRLEREGPIPVIHVGQ